MVDAQQLGGPALVLGAFRIGMLEPLGAFGGTDASRVGRIRRRSTTGTKTLSRRSARPRTCSYAAWSSGSPSIRQLVSTKLVSGGVSSSMARKAWSRMTPIKSHTRSGSGVLPSARTSEKMTLLAR